MSKLQTGQALSPQKFPAITREQLREYAVASGDPNRIHLDDAVAKKAGLPGVIAHGMLIAGFLAERAVRFIEDEAGGPGAWKLRKYQNRFRAMTFPGDEITASGTLKSANDVELVLELKATNQRDEVVCTGEAVYRR